MNLLFANLYQIQISMGNDRVANFGYNSSVFGQIERSLNGQNCFEDIDMKFKKSEAELAEIS